ncbi:MAG: amidohydrolase family protein [Treponema sp.]|jgi:predicted TIM-barrel fold metal-dependent hydrolase|nr:amidohydrolase family protein [Treponema sp.]
MVIDFHAHIYPEKIAAKAVASIEEFYKIKMQNDGTPEGLLESGRRGGIDRFVVFSAAATAERVASINDYIAKVCKDQVCKEQAGKPIEFIGFGTLHPDLKDPGAEIERLMGLGLVGIKLHPDMQKFNIDDERMMKIYALLEGKLPVVFHSGDYRYPFSHPARLAKVLDKFPKLTVVAAHFGGWSLFDLALEYFRSRHCYLDVSSSIPFLGLRRAEELIGIYGAERILFGSDYPMWDPAVCLEEFNKLKLKDADRELILCGNARRLLGANRKV